MRNVIALVILGLFIAVAGCAQQRDLAGNEPAGWEDRPGKLTAAEMMAIVAEETEAWGNMSGSETQVNLRLSRVWKAGDYTPKRKDIPELLKGMRNEKADVPARLCIADYLLELNVKEARSFISKQAGSTDFTVVENVAYLLTYHREKSPHREWAIDLALKILEVDRFAAKTWNKEELVELIQDKRKIAQLQKAVDRGENSQFYELHKYLADLRCKKAVPVLINIVRRHPDNGLIVYDLTRIDLRAAEPVLLETLVHEPTKKRYSAYEVLLWGDSESKPEVVLDMITNIEKFDRPYLRGNQSSALVELKSAKAVPILVKHLDCDGAAYFLVEIAGKQAIGPLEAYAKQKDASNRCEVKIALAKLRAKNKKELATFLLKLLLEDKRSCNAIRIVRELGECGDVRAVEPLLKLTRTWGDPRPNAGWASIGALGKIGDRRAVKPLIKLARTSGNENLMLNVVWALAEIGDRRTVEFVAEFARNTKDRSYQSVGIETLGKLGGDKAAEVVLEYARTSKDGWIVQRSIDALGKIGGHKATSGLIDLFSRDFSKVRPFGKMRRTAKTYHGFIAEALQEATGQKFGDDPAAWKAWLKKKAQKGKI